MNASEGTAPSSTTRPASDVAGVIDHTLLRADATTTDIDRVCAEAREAGFASVCVNPTWVTHAAEHLRGSAVRVCTVVGFPLGASTTRVNAFEAQDAIRDGAHELDMVLAVGAFKSGDHEHAYAGIAQIAGICREAGVLLKVILETSLLTDEETVAAARLAVRAGAGFVKTSTGFGPDGATAHDVALLRKTVGPDVGVKASGGIRTRDQMRAMLDAGATRIGTSAGLHLVSAERP